MSSNFIIYRNILDISVNKAYNEAKFDINSLFSKTNHDNIYLYKGSLKYF